MKDRNHGTSEWTNETHGTDERTIQCSSPRRNRPFFAKNDRFRRLNYCAKYNQVPSPTLPKKKTQHKRTSWIWKASSRVGASTTANSLCGFSNRAWRIGMANAPVLPEPVSASPITSLPCLVRHRNGRSPRQIMSMEQGSRGGTEFLYEQAFLDPRVGVECIQLRTNLTKNEQQISYNLVLGTRVCTRCW